MSLLAKIKSEFTAIGKVSTTVIEDITGSKELTFLKEVETGIQTVEAWIASPSGKTVEAVVATLVPQGAAVEAVVNTALTDLLKGLEVLTNNPTAQLSILKEIAANLYNLYSGKNLTLASALSAVEKAFNI